jgi:hypothetical protein
MATARSFLILQVIVMRMEPDYIIPAAPPEDFELPPEPPRRGRRKSSHATSLVDEDRISHGASSLPSEREHIADDLPRDLSLPEIPGYAAVEKPFTKPRRSKAQRPSAPGRRKRSNGHPRTYPHFYSLPHRDPPTRPLRNYSTLGPSRPPRKHKTLALEDTEQKSEPYIEIEDDIMESLSHGSARDLQSGDIIERMKGRPLPPPPRPPRKGRESREMQGEVTEDQVQMYKDEKEKEVTDEDEEPFDVSTVETLGAFSDKIFYAHPAVTSYDDEKLEEVLATENKELSTSELGRDEEEPPLILQEAKIRETSPMSLEIPVEEVSVATQTDPLPDDICVVTGDEEEVIQTANARTGTTHWVPLQQTTEFGQQTIPESPPPPTVIEKPIPYYVMPDPDTEIELKAQKLQVSELDVERLNVGELQAQKIVVSDIDGMSLQVAELTSKSGNLVVSGLELPPGFLQDLYDSLTTPISLQQSLHAPVQATTPSTLLSSTLQPSSDTSTTQFPATTLSTQTPSSQTPQSQAPSAQTPLIQAPSEQTTLTQGPTAQISMTQSPLEQTQLTHAPSAQTPMTHAPLEQTPLSKAPTAQTPMTQSSSEQTTLTQAPSAQTPMTQAPLEQTPLTQTHSAQTLPSQAPSAQTPMTQSSSEKTSLTQTPSGPTQPSKVTPAPTLSTVPSDSVHLFQPSPESTACPQTLFETSQSPASTPAQVLSTLGTPKVTPITVPQPQSQSQQVPKIPVHQTIPLQSIINPNLVTSFDGLHSYIPDYIPPQVPVSVRIPSRTRSHIQRELESEEEIISLMHTPSSRRRRHHLSKPVSRYSSDEEEEEEYSSYRPSSRHHHSSSRGPEPSIGELSRQLVHACQGVTMRALHQLVQYVAPQVREGEDKRRDLQIALCILLVLVAGLILMGFGSGKTYHHHHWDYHFPPPHP